MLENSSSDNGPKNWISFQGGMQQANNGPKMGHQPALLEPIELNDIPLHDLDPPKVAGKEHIASAGAGGNVVPSTDVAKGSPPLRPPPPLPSKPAGNTVPMANADPTVHYQKVPANKQAQKREVILEVPEATTATSPGTSSATSSSHVIIEPNSPAATKTTTGGKPEEFKNGKLLTTIFPSNAQCAWLVPPKYDCHKMPPILANKANSLPASTYAEIMRTIGSDIRFFSYAVLFSRITPIWLIFAILILLAVLASSPADFNSGGFPIMIFALVWLIMLVFGLVLCVLIRKYIVLSLRNLFTEVNKVAFQHKILVGVQDKGQLSCHKVALMFIFYDPVGCKEDTQKLLQVNQSNFQTGQPQISEAELANRAEELVCQYSQEYAKAYMKRRFLFPTRPSEGVSEFRPKHCQKNLCICQYIEREHFNKKDDKKAAPWYERVFAF